MKKKELEKKIEDLLEKCDDLRYKANKYDEVTEKLLEAEKSLSKFEGMENMRTSLLKDRVRNLTLRLDILTMTPDQIETMRKVKHRGRLEDPLDMGDTGRIRDGRETF